MCMKTTAGQYARSLGPCQPEHYRGMLRAKYQRQRQTPAERAEQDIRTNRNLGLTGHGTGF